jgi:hypothetical protein
MNFCICLFCYSSLKRKKKTVSALSLKDLGLLARVKYEPTRAIQGVEVIEVFLQHNFENFLTSKINLKEAHHKMHENS